MQSLAAIAVELLDGREPQAGARIAAGQRLAGIYLRGLRELGRIAAQDSRLARQLESFQRVEVAHYLRASGEAAAVLRMLADDGFQPLVLKGQSVAARLWPEPWMRPTGDIDVLLEEGAIGDAIAALTRRGFRAVETERRARWQPRLHAIDLDRGGMPIDLHSHLFSSIGSGLDTRAVLDRAVPGNLFDVPVRVLAPADEILFLLIHAAKHGAVRTKWLLDLHAARLVYPPEAWTEAGERAIAIAATRPAWAAARLMGSRPPWPPLVASKLRPSLPDRIALGVLVRRGESDRRAASLLWSYALAWLLEDRLSQRLRRFAGMVAHRLRPLRARPRASRQPMSERSVRWLEQSLRAGNGPEWVTLQGTSMAPSLRPGDRLLVTRVTPHSALQPGELLIVKRAGMLVAHRFVARIASKIVTRGDGASEDDPPIPEQAVLAHVVAVRRPDSGGRAAP